MSHVNVVGRYIILFDNAVIPHTVTNGMEYIRESDYRNRMERETLERDSFRSQIAEAENSGRLLGKAFHLLLVAGADPQSQIKARQAEVAIQKAIADPSALRWIEEAKNAPHPHHTHTITM